MISATSSVAINKSAVFYLLAPLLSKKRDLFFAFSFSFFALFFALVFGGYHSENYTFFRLSFKRLLGPQLTTAKKLRNCCKHFLFFFLFFLSTISRKHARNFRNETLMKKRNLSFDHLFEKVSSNFFENNFSTQELFLRTNKAKRFHNCLLGQKYIF